MTPESGVVLCRVPRRPIPRLLGSSGYPLGGFGADTPARHSLCFPCTPVAAPASRILIRGDIGQNFIHEVHSSPVLQWRRQNFGLWETFNKNVLLKDWENFEKFIKKLHKNLKNYPKILQNKIKEFKKF